MYVRIHLNREFRTRKEVTPGFVFRVLRVTGMRSEDEYLQSLEIREVRVVPFLASSWNSLRGAIFRVHCRGSANF